MGLWSTTTPLQGQSPRPRVVIVNHKSRIMLQPNWSLLLLVNIQESLQCKQGMLLVNIQKSIHCKQGISYRFYNFLWYLKQNLQLPVSIKIIPSVAIETRVK